MLVQDYIREDTLEAELQSVANPLAEGLDQALALVETIRSHAGGLAPDLLRMAKSDRPLTAEAVRDELRRGMSSDITRVSLLRRDEPATNYSVGFYGGQSPIGCTVWIAAPMSGFAAEGSARTEELVTLLVAVAEQIEAAYGYAHSGTDLGFVDERLMMDPLSGLPSEVFWLNVYGPRLLEDLGQDVVEELPAHRKLRLESGGVLWTTSASPATFATEADRVAQARALAHLRDDVEQEGVLDRLRRRSETLAPVERRFDPDMADVLELTLDSVPRERREQRAAELNAFEPAGVTEWIPVADAPPSDVDGPDDAIDRYEGLYAEQLVALLHPEIDAVMGGGPETLPEIDYHFWHVDYPRTSPTEDVQEHLVPAVGGYLGAMMVRHLGGRWVPRRNLDEAQVVIGDRAWLPFKRARHYLEDRESALRYSLTKYYRTAERISGSTA